MQKILTSAQTRDADAYTIKKRQLLSVDLMEDASLAFATAFTKEVTDKDTPVAVLCGGGNNGGDGLAIARLLSTGGYQQLAVYLIDFSARKSEEYQMNLQRLKALKIPVQVISTPAQLPDLHGKVIIDAILGSGLNKVLKGDYLALAQKVNALNTKVIAVDVPTGFPAEGIIPKDGIFLKADLVICFQRPKLNFFFPESAAAMDRFEVVPIGLDEEFIEASDSPYQLIEAADITALVKPRKSFTHKGTYGHALIIAGQPETMGAALLSATACLYGGAGLTTVSIPDTGLTALNALLPEVMYLNRDKLEADTLKKFTGIAVGPGLGTGKGSVDLVKSLLALNTPLIIDADALNILSEHPELLKKLPSGSILTPHMKEFDHLFGKHESWWERLATARTKAVATGCVIVLKNQYTFIVKPDGTVGINPTGNPAMAQGGMGDVLTGLVSAFFVQGYAKEQAAYIACFLHGRSGDELALHETSVTASEVAKGVPKTLKGLIK